MSAHLAIVDPALRIPELDCLNRIALRCELPVTYHLPALFGSDSLRRAEADIAGIVLLGSGASVNEPPPWQGPLEDWLRPRLLDGVPALGICFGHQLLARMFGGEVAYLHPDRRKRRGLRAVRLAANELWGEATEGPVLVTHGEHVSRVPEGFEVVGASDEVAVEAMAHRTLPIWGFQCHVEATPAFARNNDVPFDGDEDTLAFAQSLVDRFLMRVAVG